METLHPISVHFPIALILTATLISLLAVVIKSRRKDLLVVLYWVMIIGAFSTLISLFTGLYESGQVVHNNIIHEIMEIHELLGYVISAVFVVLTLWVFVRNKKLKARELYFVSALLVVTSAILVYSAYLGGQMVYEQGAGVKPMEKIIEQMHGGNGHSHTGGVMMDSHSSDKKLHDDDGHSHSH